MKPKVVFDTNIYICALLSPRGGGGKLFNLFRQRKIELYTSRGQIAELVEAPIATRNELVKKRKESFLLEACLS